MRDGDETGLVMQPSIEHVLEFMFAIRLGDDLVHTGLVASLTRSGFAGNPVGFRNIWVRPFQAARGEQVRKPYLRDGEKETPIEE